MVSSIKMNIFQYGTSILKVHQDINEKQRKKIHITEERMAAGI